MYGLLDCEPYTRAQRGGLIDVREMRKHALGDLGVGVRLRAYIEHGPWKSEGIVLQW